MRPLMSARIRKERARTEPWIWPATPSRWSRTFTERPTTPRRPRRTLQARRAARTTWVGVAATRAKRCGSARLRATLTTRKTRAPPSDSAARTDPALAREERNSGVRPQRIDDASDEIFCRAARDDEGPEAVTGSARRDLGDEPRDGMYAAARRKTVPHDEHRGRHR